MTNRNNTRRLHAAAGAIALFTIGCFMGSTLWSEFTQDPAMISQVKTTILMLMPFLVVAMAVVSRCGFKLAGNSTAGAVGKKWARMKIIGPNGLLILVPASIYLARKAEANAFDTAFNIVQVIELIAGSVNIVLLALNMRDGMTIRTRRLSAREIGNPGN